MGKRQITKVSWILAFCSVFLGVPSHANDHTALFMLQVTMAEHGFDSGDPDGLMGPATREAIAGFSEKYNLPDDPDAMIRELSYRSIRHSLAITEEAGLSDNKLEEIKNGVAETLRDPSSVQIKKVRIVEKPDGRFYCGEVNGKNAYGAYAGFTTFSSGSIWGLDGVTHMPVAFYIDDPDSTFSFWRCALAIPLRE